MFNIAIVEDQTSSIDILKTYIKQYAKAYDVQFNINVFHDGLNIVEGYIADLDVIFMDIEMAHLDGMSAAKKIRQFDSNVIIIFVTNVGEYAIEGYHVNALSFLLKPLTYFALSQELHKSLAKIKDKKEKFITINTNNGFTKINTAKINYIEVMKHTLTIYTTTEEILFRGTMKHLENELKPFHFFRCNNCYLVNLARVNAIQGDYAVVNKQKLKISRPRKKAFMKALTMYAGRNY